MSVKKITRLAIFLTIGVGLNYIESFIPLPLLFPGAKLGLANSIGLLVLYYLGGKYYLGYILLRVLLSAIIWSGFGFAFWISLAGAVLASLVVLLCYRSRVFSIWGLSVIGAVMHGIGQTIMVAILYQTPYMLSYVLILSISGVITGLLIAFLSVGIIKRVRLS